MPQMNDFEKKCYEIFEKENKEAIEGKDWERIAELFDKTIDDEYRWILDHFRDVFVKEEMNFKAVEKTPLATEDGWETFSYFFGVSGKENIFTAVDRYQGQLPADLIPIGSIDGGNLLCRNRNNPSIYIWLHDQAGKNVYLAGKSLKDFVMGFQRNQDCASCQKDLGVTGVRLSQELLNELMGLGK